MNSRQARRVSVFTKSKINESEAYGDLMRMYSGSTELNAVQNSYKLEPDERFPTKEVRVILENTLKEHLKEKKYSEGEWGKFCPELSDMIKEKVKNLAIPRYKFVTVVNIGENKDQSARVASRCLWNHKYDTYVSAGYYSETIFAQATVYAIYVE